MKLNPSKIKLSEKPLGKLTGMFIKKISPDVWHNKWRFLWWRGNFTLVHNHDAKSASIFDAIYDIVKEYSKSDEIETSKRST